jgi:DNA-binding response OmpR family regulator
MVSELSDGLVTRQQAPLLAVIVSARTVDIHIRRLRAKLGIVWLETIRGVGYKFRRRR